MTLALYRPGFLHLSLLRGEILAPWRQSCDRTSGLDGEEETPGEWWSAASSGAILRHSFGAGWSSPVARRAHNPKVAGSNPAPATIEKPRHKRGFFFGK